MPVANATVFHSATDRGQMQANAQIIAAAPDLLSACREALEYGANLPPDSQRLIRAAIHKAEKGRRVMPDEPTIEEELEALREPPRLICPRCQYGPQPTDEYPCFSCLVEETADLKRQLAEVTEELSSVSIGNQTCIENRRLRSALEAIRKRVFRSDSKIASDVDQIAAEAISAPSWTRRGG